MARRKKVCRLLICKNPEYVFCWDVLCHAIASHFLCLLQDVRLQNDARTKFPDNSSDIEASGVMSLVDCSPKLGLTMRSLCVQLL